MADLTKTFEELLAKSKGGKYVLRLYVAGSTPQSSRAIQTLEQVCKTYLKDRCELCVVDLYQQPELAKAAQILAAPTLVKELPLPLRRLIGELSSPERLLLALDLKPDES